MLRPDVHGTCDLYFFQAGCVINDMAKDVTAFVHRDSQWIALIPSSLINDHEWQDNFYDFLLKGFQVVRAYQSFPDVLLGN